MKEGNQSLPDVPTKSHFSCLKHIDHSRGSFLTLILFTDVIFLSILLTRNITHTVPLLLTHLLMYSPNMFPHLIVSRAKAPPFAPTRRLSTPSAPLHGAKDLDFFGHVRVVIMASEVCLSAKGEIRAAVIEALEFTARCDVSNNRIGLILRRNIGSPTTLPCREKWRQKRV
jgi:hypothetical protein